MNMKQILIAAAVVALAPLAAQAGASTQKFGEAYPVEITDSASVLSRADVRDDVLALDREAQSFGEPFPHEMKDPMTTRQLADVRHEARNAPRMYGEASGERGHN
jgi:hypothetical protein